MPYNSQRHHRRSIRLPGYDYAQPGMYFVTLVTHDRRPLFGEIAAGEMHLNRIGQIAKWEWERLPRRFAWLALDEYIIMPNHIHAILIIRDTVGATRSDQVEGHARPDELFGREPQDTSRRVAPTGSRLHGPAPGSLGAIIGQFKSRLTKRIWAMKKRAGRSPLPIWQRNYYEHIIRDDNELARIREYIRNNPANWLSDRENRPSPDNRQDDLEKE